MKSCVSSATPGHGVDGGIRCGLLLASLVVVACAWDSAGPAGSAETMSSNGDPSGPMSRSIALGDYESAVRFQPNASALTPPCPPSVLQFALDRLDDPAWTQSNRPQWSTEALFEVVEAALRRSHASLPGLPPDVCVGLAARPDDPVLRRMGGIGGATVAPDVVALFVAPNLNPTLLDVLPFTIAHEYHHAVHWESWPTGLDVLIREGQAHHFAWTLYPEMLHPSASALARNQIGTAWQAMRPHLGEPSRQFMPAYMFGGAQNGNRVPGWAGYTIGFCLVWDYAERHPGLAPAQIAGIPAQEFIVDIPRCPERQPAMRFEQYETRVQNVGEFN